MYNDSKIIAASFALTAFAVAVVAGISVGNPAEDVLSASLLALIVCFFVGLLASRILGFVAFDHVARHKALRPPVRVGDEPVHNAVQTVENKNS